MVRRRSGGSAEDIGGRDIDSVTDTELIQAKDTNSATEKPRNFLNGDTRRQIKATVAFAEERGKKAVYWFRKEPHPEVRQYLEGKGIEVRVGMEVP